MSWKSLCKDWFPIALAAAVCGAACYLHARAWQLGYSGPDKGLMGFYLGGAILLLLAWFAVVAAFQAGTHSPKPAGATGATVGDMLVFLVAVPGCLGCYPLWPFVLLWLTMWFVVVTLKKRGAPGSDWRLAALRAGIAALLFVLTWYLCASTTRQALHGFGERIEDTVGEERLIAWATKVIAARRPGKLNDANRGHLTPAEIPEDIHDLMGGRLEQISVEVRTEGADPYIAINGRANQALRITVRPSRLSPAPGIGPPRWCIQDSAGLEWRPGIVLDTVGNFR